MLGSSEGWSRIAPQRSASAASPSRPLSRPIVSSSVATDSPLGSGGCLVDGPRERRERPGRRARGPSPRWHRPRRREARVARDRLRQLRGLRRLARGSASPAPALNVPMAATTTRPGALRSPARARVQMCGEETRPASSISMMVTGRWNRSFTSSTRPRSCQDACMSLRSPIRMWSGENVRTASSNARIGMSSPTTPATCCVGTGRRDVAEDLTESLVGFLARAIGVVRPEVQPARENGSDDEHLRGVVDELADCGGQLVDRRSLGTGNDQESGGFRHAVIICPPASRSWAGTGQASLFGERLRRRSWTDRSLEPHFCGMRADRETRISRS